MTVLGISGNYLKAFKLVQKRICLGNAFKQTETDKVMVKQSLGLLF